MPVDETLDEPDVDADVVTELVTVEDAELVIELD